MGIKEEVSQLWKLQKSFVWWRNGKVWADFLTLFGLFVDLLHFRILRKIPWINIYAEVNQEKEQEMIGSVGQGDATPKITLSEFSTAKEVMEKELDTRGRSKWRSSMFSSKDAQISDNNLKYQLPVVLGAV